MTHCCDNHSSCGTVQMQPPPPGPRAKHWWPLAMSGFADVGASLLVVGNGLRMLKEVKNARA